MCTFILESDTFSKCCHWRWRGGKRYCQHRAVIKRWKAGQQSTRAGSHLMFFSRVPPKPGATHINWQQPQTAAFGHACSNHSPHLPIRSCKMPHVRAVAPPCQPGMFAYPSAESWQRFPLGRRFLFVRICTPRQKSKK